jgi:class 3 adenylate cyclase
MALSESATAKLTELRGSNASPVVVDRLTAMLSDGSDLDCYKINAFRLAAELAAPRADVVRALLAATRLGLFDLNWDIHCPSCRGVPEFHHHLAGIRERGHCAHCAIDWQLDIEEQVEVTFTANPDARRIDFSAFAMQPGKMDWYFELLDREGRKPPVAGAPADAGPTKHWVSATYITSQQDFRDLFAGEFLSPDASFAVQSVTLLFSDVKGSTDMYETLGDARAYAIVQKHFAFMTEIIRRHEGGVVKTIGDAVMATFPQNADGVRAACEIQEALAGTGDPLRDVEVKIGLHRGPAIVVTSNRNVDYFGRTVNIAARTQSQANAREVLLTDAVISDPAVTTYLAGRALVPRVFEANVKGVALPLRLHALLPAP